MGLSGAAAAAGAAILLGSSAAPAFAGWTASPTAPLPGQLAAAEQRCAEGAGTPALSDTRGPYTASIYADGTTCLQGNGITINSSSGGAAQSSIPAGTIELRGAGESDSDGHALTMVDGPIGAGVTGVTITRTDGSSVQATVKNGWYLAWWPGTERAVTAQVASAEPEPLRNRSRPRRTARARPVRRTPPAAAATALRPRRGMALDGRRYRSPAAAAACGEASAFGVGDAAGPPHDQRGALAGWRRGTDETGLRRVLTETETARPRQLNRRQAAAVALGGQNPRFRFATTPTAIELVTRRRAGPWRGNLYG